MPRGYAKDQPAGFENRIERVAVVGAGGQIGAFITKHLLATGRHTVTALTRAGSASALPAGVTAVPVDYDSEDSLAAALRGQQFLVITLSVRTPPGTQERIVRAAGRAGVAHIMPNIYGGDTGNAELAKDIPLPSTDHARLTAEIEALRGGDVTWNFLICGLWYEYSLVMGEIWFGFDFPQRRLTCYDGGETKVNVTTWEQCGRAVTALASLKLLPEDEGDASRTLSAFRNRPVAISSFRISQRDMFESWKRVSGETDADWTVEHEASRARYDDSMAALRAVESDALAYRMAAARAAFVRLFFPNGGGDYETVRGGLDNEALGLPSEDLDERTRVAQGMLGEGYAAKVFARLRS